MAGQIRVLHDIRVAGPTDYPDSGIPQDTRLLFKTLSVAPDIAVSILLHPQFRTTRFARVLAQSPTAAAAMLLNGYGINQGSRYPRNLVGKIRSLYDGLRQPAVQPVLPVNPLLADSVWRCYLQRSLAAEDRALVDRAEIVVSGVTEQALAGSGRRQDMKIATAGYDFILFPDLRRAHVSPGTVKLIRYHDALPLIAADLFPPGVARSHYELLRRCVRDCFFVCNSEPTRRNLVALYPATAARSAVIPCTLGQATEASELEVSGVVANNRVGAYGDGGEGVGHSPAPFVNGEEFILMVSTIEPRKNHLTAIEAFARLRERLARPLKFVIVGKPAMGFDTVQRAMEPMLRDGSIIHLAGVPRRDLNELYARARALIFPSLDEGFGYTPLEALSAGTPAVVSDVATHRWVLEDAVLYAPALNAAAFADQLERLVALPGRDALVAGLRDKGRRVLDRYSVARTALQWSHLLKDIKAGRGAAQT